jgi:hypothetical protein
VERIDAIDGNALPPDTQDMFPTQLNRTLPQSSKGWKRVTDICPPDSFALIFEDDAHLGHHFKEIWEHSLGALEDTYTEEV